MRIRFQSFCVLVLLTAAGCLGPEPDLQGHDPEFFNFLKSSGVKITGFKDHADGGSFCLEYPNDTNRYYIAFMHLIDKAKEKQSRRDDARREQQENAKTHADPKRQLGITCREGSICTLSLLASERVRRTMPQYTFAIATCLDAGMDPAFVTQPLVMGTNCNPVILANPPTAAAFLSKHIGNVKNLEQAREVLLTFTELQSFVLCKSMPKEVSNWEGAENPEWIAKWTYVEKKTDVGWRFLVVFLTDAQIRSYSQYQVDIERGGRISVKELAHLGQEGEYL